VQFFAQAPAAWAEFTRTFQAYADSDQVVGASVVLMKNGRIIGRHDIGHANRDKRVAVDSQTIFHWGSITKSLTAISIMQLRDRGKLTLDDKIVRWVPELRAVHDPFGMMDSITIRMLLSHTAGFQGGTWPYGNNEPWEPFEPTTWNQLVAMMPYQRLRFRPGSRYGYSNPGYIYLARVIEQVSGDPWAVYVQKNIWAPLGLTRGYVGRTPYHLAADRGHGYRGDSLGAPPADLGAEFDPGITIPNGGWNAPMDDLGRYAAFLTGSGAAVLARATLEEMWRPAHATGAGLPEFSDVGLGFFSLEAEGRRVVGHTGDQAGYRSFLYLDPVRRTALVLAFNTTREGGAAASSLGALARDGLSLLR